MKNILAIVSVLLIIDSGKSKAQQAENLYTVKSNYQVGAYINTNDTIKGLGDIYWGIKINGKWGIIDTKRILKVPIIYDEISPNHKGIFWATLDGKDCYISSNGNYIIPPVYDKIYRFNNGRSYDFESNDWYSNHLNTDITIYKIGDKEGYIDINGKVITDAIFSQAYSFVSDVACVKKDGKWGLLNRNGVFVIPCSFKEIKSYLYNGFNVIRVKNDKNQVAFYNKIGELIMPFSNLQTDYSDYEIGSYSTADQIPPFIKISGSWQVLKNTQRLIPDYGIKITEHSKQMSGFKNSPLGKYYYSLSASPVKSSNLSAVSSVQANTNNTSVKAISCSFKFSRPFSTYKYIDNRVVCSCCKERFIPFIKLSQNEIDDAKAAASIGRIKTDLIDHFLKIDASDEHKKYDNDRFEKYIKLNYKLGLNSSFADLGASLFYSVTKVFGGTFTNEIELYKNSGKKYCRELCMRYCD